MFEPKLQPGQFKYIEKIAKLMYRNKEGFKISNGFTHVCY
jgi:hypothetical protein